MRLSILWDVLLGAIVAATMAITTLILAGITAGALAGLGFLANPVPLHALAYRALVDHLAVVGGLALFSVLLIVVLYEVALIRWTSRAGRARFLTRQSLFRALTGGGAAGAYAALVVLTFTPLARGALGAELAPGWVLGFGLLPSTALIAASALAHTFAGEEATALQRGVPLWERLFLLALPLSLGVLLGLLFGAAAAGIEGFIKAVLGSLVTYGLVQRLTKTRADEVKQFLEALLEAQGAPTESAHRA